MTIIEAKNIKVSDLVQGYITDSSTGQVTAVNGRLNVRPAYRCKMLCSRCNREKSNY